MSQLSHRQGVTSDLICNLLPKNIKDLVKTSELDTALADSLYSGYIQSQQNASERVNHNDNLKIPENINFKDINGLSNEMIERLERENPQTFGQIKKINGITHTALSTVLVYLSSSRDRQEL